MILLPCLSLEGLILGTVVSKTRSVVDDASDTRIKTVYTTIVGDNENSFKAIPVEISNMVESPQEDYQSFQSNLAPASGIARHSASVGMTNTIKAVPTTALVDGHEAMFIESFEATKVLAMNVLDSEKAVKAALEEIEMLKEQLENAKVMACMQRRQHSGQDGYDVSGTENRHHHHQQHQYVQHARPSIHSQRSFTSPPDLLY
ncbi:hypothetical protein BGX31_007510 [Mortierella sp. GBA43]|nr:hypothetical protein BGX31_007510 [Mortierella sp. GBA43]